MSKNKAKNYTDLAAGIIMLVLFAVGMIAALIAGAGAYRRIVKRDEMAYNARISEEYISEKINSAPGGMLKVLELKGTNISALAISDREDCVTYIYCCDGWLRELYTFSDSEPDIGGGEKLIEMQALNFSMEDGMLTANITTADGIQRWLFSCIETEKGESGS